ncbi:MAG: NADPH-dependent glutamate synthase [Oscillospiraceae bacterium]|nr:NADPH-dependent glutamate synthase [Oscillospiraceae bacterium]
MANNQKIKTKISEQDPNIRNKNFSEVSLGYTDQEAVNEAERCLNCKNKPCVAGCPVAVKIPEFIGKIAAGEFEEAYNIIVDTNTLPAICGRVCPQETQCEELCIRAKAKDGESVGIGRLERFAADCHMKNNPDTVSVNVPVGAQKNNIKIAIVGSGPAGLTCAGDLAKLGYSVDIFEALHVAGGVLTYGIPEFRLPKAIVAREIQTVKSLGVNIETNMAIGRILTIDELLSDEYGYKAVFVGSGAGLPNFLGIEGENLGNVLSANEYLTRINLMKAYEDDYDTPVVVSKNVAVIGGGNVAMDAARCAKRMGAENVYIVYRRSEVEMPARIEEVHHAKEEGIIFKTLTNPTRIIGDDKGNITSMELTEMVLGEPDEKGRRRPIEKPDSLFNLEVDTVIVAIGTSPNPIIKNTTPDIETLKWGTIKVLDDGVSTTKKGVFAGGDAVSGAATVILAMGAGKKAAVAIDEYVKRL